MSDVIEEIGTRLPTPVSRASSKPSRPQRQTNRHPSQVRHHAPEANSTQAGKRPTVRRSSTDPDTAARLKAARLKAGFRSAGEFARETGVKRMTYMHHENGHRSITQRAAERYAALLGTTATSLLFGDDTEELRSATGAFIVGTIRGDGIVTLTEAKARQRSIATAALNDNLVAHEIVDDALYPAYRPGDMVMTKPLTRPGFKLQDVDGLECLCELSGGEMLLRQVIVDGEGRSATLVAYHAPPRMHCKLLAASPVICVMRNLGVRQAAE